MLTTDCIIAKIAISMYDPWLVLRQPKEDFTFTQDWKTHKRKTVFVPESKGVPVHGKCHSHAIYHKAHFPLTLPLIPRNLQDKSLCLKTPFHQIFHLASQCCNSPHLFSSSSALEPPGTSVAGPAKYLSYFTKAKEQLAKKDNCDHFAPLKSIKINLLITASVLLRWK